MPKDQTKQKKELIATVHRREIYACRDEDSLWVRVKRLKGRSRDFSPERARAYALALMMAADRADALENKTDHT